ncbi:MAG: nucleoside hydrolase [Synergistaceae bacterium]|nr:nucleoside hydrolase [Synergistaceae bacterium]
MGKFSNFLTGKAKGTIKQKFSWIRAIAFVIFTVAVIMGGRFIVVGLPEVKTNVWLDTGSLPDDNIALAMTVANRDTINLCGVTVQPLTSDRKTALKNVITLLSLFGAEKVPVAEGAHNALLQQQAAIDKKYILGDLDLNDNGKNYTVDNSILYMRNAIMSLPKKEKITVVAVAPLTTEAILLKTFPEVATKIERFIIMGGAIKTPGNVTPYAEFNVYQDPDAFDIVLKSGVPITLVPLDLTQRLLVPRENFEQLLNSDKEELTLIGKLIEHISNSKDEYGGQAAPIHDMICLQYLTRPQNFTGYYADVKVIRDGEQRGKIVVTPKDDKDNDAIFILSDCTQENFVATFNEDLKKLVDYIYYFKAKK